jgi:cell division protein FtsB
MEMTLQQEIEHLKKRRDELKTIVNNLQDIYDWFDKNAMDHRAPEENYEQTKRR